MSTFTKAFRGVKAGEIYPTEFNAGDECPPELEAGAASVGAIASSGTAPDLTPAQKFVDGNATDVIASLDGVTDAAALSAARDAEVAGKNRSTVLAAMDAAVAKIAGGQG